MLIEDSSPVCIQRESSKCDFDSEVFKAAVFEYSTVYEIWTRVCFVAVVYIVDIFYGL